MSIHPSLRTSEKNKKQRSVLKRSERLKAMFEKKQWKEGDNVYGLPKIKTLRIKIKKEKAQKAETADAKTTGTKVGAGVAAAVPAAKKTK